VVCIPDPVATHVSVVVVLLGELAVDVVELVVELLVELVVELVVVGSSSRVLQFSLHGHS
jgi:hypothetical protein